MKNRIVFFGTPHFAAEVFRYLVSKKVPIVGVVTQPDRPKGRSLVVTPSPVKEAAVSLLPNVPIFQPAKASEESFLQKLLDLKADLYVVVAFGQILSQTLLSQPPLGCINVHASLLPKYRGAAPMQRCLMAGEKETGIAIQKMVKQMDAGDVIASVKVSIPQEMNLGELERDLCEAAKPLLWEVIRSYEEGIPFAKPQDHAFATFAPKIDPDEGEIHWSDPAEKIQNLIRAFSPRPGAWTRIESGQKKMKILRAQLEAGLEGKPGELIHSREKEGIVACGKGALRILEVQPEGKKVMSWAEWFRGSLRFAAFE